MPETITPWWTVTLNEWSEWQLKNLNAIVWLYRGEKNKYKELLHEYLCYFRTVREYLIGKSAKRVFLPLTESKILRI